jgi:hypothetical protein
MDVSSSNEDEKMEIKTQNLKERNKINSQRYRNNKKLNNLLSCSNETPSSSLANNTDIIHQSVNLDIHVEPNDIEEMLGTETDNVISDEVSHHYYDDNDNDYDDDDYNYDENEADDSYNSQIFNQNLYLNAQIKLAEFNTLFMSLITALNLPETHSERVYEFIKLILPENSTMLDTYYRFKKHFNYNLIKEIKLCHICHLELKDNKCLSESCVSHSLEKKVVIKKSIKVVTADIETQIRLVLHNHYSSIVKYKCELQKETMITDLCNGSNYDFEDDKISLILFTDAVTYTKSVSNKSMWACFSCIAELPPALRFSAENILFHSLWSSSFVDFQLYLKKYNNAIDNIIKTGVMWNGKKIKVEVLGFIADSPARSKAINSLQFNGKFGCIFCLHPTARNSKNTTQIYPILPDIPIRTNKVYIEQIKTGTPEVPFKGIKGPTHLHKWIDIPSGVILDYMHLCLLGSFKTILTYILDNKNKKHDLGRGVFGISKYISFKIIILIKKMYLL